MSDLTIYSDEELKAIQSLELECLKAVMLICKENDIEYFAIGGTALGAVRHKGFIPWDDDIDIGMTRENYRKFLLVAPRCLPKQYHLQTPYDSKRNPYAYAKVRIDGTRFVEYCNRNVDMHHGVYIDIFPFDEVPDDEESNRKQFKQVQKLIRLFSLRQSPDVSVEPHTFFERTRAAARCVLHLICQLMPYDTVFKKLEETVTKYDGTNQQAIACLFSPVRLTEYVLLCDLYPLCEAEFMDVSIMIPGSYNTYLTTHYGDYMRLPPKERRFGHKPYEVFLGLMDHRREKS